jgi:hypothetical protein
MEQPTMELMSFMEWRERHPVKKRRKKMSQEALKQTEKSGLRMVKDKVLDIIRRSPSKEFMFSQVPNSKDIVIVVRQM